MARLQSEDGKAPGIVRGCIVFFALFVIASWAAGAEQLDYTVLAREAHDPGIFTQGFVLDRDVFYESSGHYGRSFLLRYPKQDDTGETKKRLALPRNVFAEGIEVVGDHLYLLSWREGKAWALDKHSLEVRDEYRYRGEGWGLTHDGERLIMSDGTDSLRFYSETFQALGSRRVHLKGEPVRNLNELEYQGGLVWANQWRSDTIYAIDPESGAVRATVDLPALRREAGIASGESVLNGIAYDQTRNAFWVTGKYWRYRYLLRFERPETPTGD
jgi:glutamine cyclotransferase